MYGKLTVVTGPMFGGKSSHIITATTGRNDAIVFKPHMDIRYSPDEVVTHLGGRVPATPVRFPDDLCVADRHTLVCIDEIQFFSDPYYCGDIVKTIQIFLRAGREVVASGLDTDWRGEAFPITAALMAMADEVIKLKARCAVCGQPASKTFKKTKDHSVVELGSSDIYEARCNAHWHQHP